MPTTIQVTDTTKQLLEVYKERKHASSFDEVIQNLLRDHINIPKSMFGVSKGMRWNKKEDRMQPHEL